MLDANHFGLEKVKERILEFLAVRKLAPEGRAPILCLVGPPGVGKTSLGRSVAEAMGREFVRVSLGGVRDEAEIRGHRRTYVSALPGRDPAIDEAGEDSSIPFSCSTKSTNSPQIFAAIPRRRCWRCSTPNRITASPITSSRRRTILSKVFFILTANVLDTIPAPLRDRMEVIEVPGYTEEEKAQIAHQFLIPRQMRDSGLNASRIEIDEGAVRRIIREYTFEAGVRGLIAN